MKKLLLFLVLASGIQVVSSQDTVRLWTRYPGYVITLEGDTIKGALLLRNKISNQSKVFFFKDMDADEPQAKYHAKDIRGYQVGPRTYCSLKFSGQNAMRNHNFLLVVVEGPLTLYKWYYDDTERLKIDDGDVWNAKIDLSFDEKGLSYQSVLTMPDGRLIDLSDMKYVLGFKKNMSKLLSDCTELADHIARKDKGYTLDDMEAIAGEYNTWYLREHQKK